MFASSNGLALLAEHLPLLYPEISRQMNSSESGEVTPNVTVGNDPSQDWVTVDSYPEDFYMVCKSKYYIFVLPATEYLYA